MYALKNDGSGWRSVSSSLDINSDETFSIDQPSLVVPVLPNGNKFIQDCKTGLGGIVSANSFAKAYPLFMDAVVDSVWPDVQALIIDAHTTAVFNNTQYAAVKAAALANNIPVTLP